jgi:hypothetical protein
MNEMIIGFVLGIATVIVIAGLVMGVIAFSKVIKLKKSINNDFEDLVRRVDMDSNANETRHDEISNDFGRGYDEIKTDMDTRTTSLYNSINVLEEKFNRTLDSRLEKLEQKLTKK